MKLVLILALAGCADERSLGVTCGNDCGTPSIHAAGILDPASPDFHATDLRKRNWDFPLCATCHGTDFSGGISRVSCLTCHAAGPTACVTCHGPTGPASNAHPAHAVSGVACAECHVSPATWDAPGHIVGDGGPITGAVPVVFGARAGVTIDPADRAGPPGFDGTTCSNVYCHGGELHAAGGTRPSPVWADQTPAGACTQCHGNPPPTEIHSIRTDCHACHPASAAHIDGIVEVGTTCNGCHGSPASPAPPTDLEGNMFTTAIGVGAHQAHLQALSRISAPIPCAACHLVPATIDSPGHIDTPAPAEVVASLGWDRGPQTCASAYCHGTARPVWTSSGQVSCGTCHGIPPIDASHTPGMTLTSCVACHPGTVDAFGNILVTNGTSEHINGIVDLQ